MTNSKKNGDGKAGDPFIVGDKINMKGYPEIIYTVQHIGTDYEAPMGRIEGYTCDRGVISFEDAEKWELVESPAPLTEHEREYEANWDTLISENRKLKKEIARLLARVERVKNQRAWWTKISNILATKHANIRDAHIAALEQVRKEKSEIARLLEKNLSKARQIEGLLDYIDKRDAEIARLTSVLAWLESEWNKLPTGDNLEAINERIIVGALNRWKPERLENDEEGG